MHITEVDVIKNQQWTQPCRRRMEVSLKWNSTLRKGWGHAPGGCWGARGTSKKGIVGRPWPPSIRQRGLFRARPSPPFLRSLFLHILFFCTIFTSELDLREEHMKSPLEIFIFNRGQNPGSIRCKEPLTFSLLAPHGQRTPGAWRTQWEGLPHPARPDTQGPHAKGSPIRSFWRTLCFLEQDIKKPGLETEGEWSRCVCDGVFLSSVERKNGD